MSGYFRNGLTHSFLLLHTTAFIASCLLWKMFIINICYGICKAPSARRSPFYTLLQAWLELLQQVVLGNKRHSLLEVVLDKCVVTALAEDTIIDDRNFLRWNDVLKTGMQVFLAGINGATSVAQTSGGGGTTSDMPWRDKGRRLSSLDMACYAVRSRQALSWQQAPKKQRLLVSRVRVYNQKTGVSM